MNERIRDMLNEVQGMSIAWEIMIELAKEKR